MNTSCETSDLLVFSHLRWDFVFQRPQHLMARFAQHRRVFYFEEPIFGMTDIPTYHTRLSQEGVHVITPYLPSNIGQLEAREILREMVDELILDENLTDYSLWYYSPAAFSFTQHLQPFVILFDWIEETPLLFIQHEKLLLKKADVVFTEGDSLYKAKKNLHQNIHPFPSPIIDTFLGPITWEETFLKMAQQECKVTQDSSHFSAIHTEGESYKFQPMES